MSNMKKQLDSVLLLKHKIWERDNYICHYCGLKMKDSYFRWRVARDKAKSEHKKIPDRNRSTPLTVDHIIPRDIGGEFREDNLVTACINCNIAKGNHEIEKSIPLRDQTIVFRLLGVLVKLGDWSKKKRLRNSIHLWKQ